MHLKIHRTMVTLLTFFAVSAPYAMAKEVLLVANNNDGTASVIDAKSNTVSCTLNLNPDLEERRREFGWRHRFANWWVGWKYADFMLVSADKSVLYVTRASVADIVAFHLPDMKILWRTPIKGYRADHAMLSPDGTRIFVAAISEKVVQVLDAKTGAIVGEIPTGEQPHAIHFSPSGKIIYIGEKVGRHILAVDPTTLTVKESFEFPDGVRPFEITHDENRVYLQLSNFHGFIEYDLKAKKILNTVTLPKTDAEKQYDGKYPAEAAHHGLVLSQDETMLCLAATASDYVALVSRPELKTQAQIPVGKNPGWAITSLDGKNCIVTCRGSNEISIISYSEKKEVARIKVGSFPQRVIDVDFPFDLCQQKK